MRFDGALKFPEIDHPGVPIQLLIEGSQAELVVDGDSLGRWSLYDIHARRLVASAFLIDLDGTEVTFVADDPVDFAYRGVEHMAETWATIKSKRLASRALAVRKSRQGTAPSRIEEMRAAMEANLDTRAGSGPDAGEATMPEPKREDETVEPRAEWDRRDGEASIPVVGPGTALEADEAADFRAHDLAEQARLLEEERRLVAEERAKLEEERRVASQREADRIEAYRLEMKRLETEREALRRRAETIEEATGEPEPESEPESESEPEPEPESEPEPEPALRGVVDLDDLGGGSLESDVPGSASPPASSTDPEPALAGAPKDKGGLMGAVRAAFRTGSRDHEHQFIEAPGGIGITRYVCEECGYVSISV